MTLCVSTALGLSSRIAFCHGPPKISIISRVLDESVEFAIRLGSFLSWSLLDGQCSALAYKMHGGGCNKEIVRSAPLAALSDRTTIHPKLCATMWNLVPFSINEQRCACN